MTFDGGWPEASLLGLVQAASQEKLLASGIPTTYEQGDRLLQQGDHSDHALLLVTGYVKVVVYTEAGTETLLGIRTGGDLIGEMAALSHKPRSATIVACGEVHARRISAADLSRLIENGSDISGALARMIGERLRWANDRRLDLVTAPAATRVIRILLEVARIYRTGPDHPRYVSIALTQSELASLAGTSPSSAEKVLRQLEQGRIIERGYRNIIVDFERLRSVAETTPANP